MSVKIDRIKDQVKGIFQSWVETIREINERYKTPRIKMTRGVRIALFVLRVYLLTLIVLMFYKFFTIATGH